MITFLRKPSVVKTAHGHDVYKWCGSCAFKEIRDGVRMCNKFEQQVEIDDICMSYELDEKLAKI